MTNAKQSNPTPLPMGRIDARTWLKQLRMPSNWLTRLREMKIGEELVIGAFTGPGITDRFMGTCRASITRIGGKWQFDGVWSIMTKRKGRACFRTDGEFVLERNTIRFLDNESAHRAKGFELICRYIEWTVRHTDAEYRKKTVNTGITCYWRGELFGKDGCNSLGIDQTQAHPAPVLYRMAGKEDRMPELPDTFRSVTTWQSGDFEVHIVMGRHKTFVQAKLLAVLPTEIEHQSDCLLIRCKVTGKVIYKAGDDDVTVYRRKPGSTGRTVLTDNDFERMPISIRDFEQHPELCSLGSQSYGVITTREA